MTKQKLIAATTAAQSMHIGIALLIALGVAHVVFFGVVALLLTHAIPPGARVTLPAVGTVTPEPGVAVASAPKLTIENRDGWVMVTVPAGHTLFAAPTPSGPWMRVGDYVTAGTLAEVADDADEAARFWAVKPIEP